HSGRRREMRRTGSKSRQTASIFPIGGSARRRRPGGAPPRARQTVSRGRVRALPAPWSAPADGRNCARPAGWRYEQPTGRLTPTARRVESEIPNPKSKIPSMSNVRQFGAAGDGQRDDTQSIEHALSDGDGLLE